MRRSSGALAALVAALILPAAAAAKPFPPGHAKRVPLHVEVTPGCDPLDPVVCLQPWPNDHFTRRDRSTATGRRLDLRPSAMPRNAAGVPIRPDEYNRNDGFSPGSPIHVKIPGLDSQAAFERTGLVPITDMARTYDRRQPAVVIDAATGRRHLIWAELDANAHTDADRNLYIRPGVNWREGHRYVVALRDLRDATGRPLEPSPVFRAYRDRIPTDSPAVEERRGHMESVFRTLKRAHVKRKDLYLAWDFTVGSERRIAGRMLGIRDDAFAQLGDRDLSDGDVPPASAAPAVLGESATDVDDANIARVVNGSFLVPCYLDAPGCPPGSKFAYADLDSNTPLRLEGNTAVAQFTCIVPRRALDGEPMRLSLYGHGLFGSRNEVTAGNVKAMAQEHGFVFCATDWWGMAQADIPVTAGLILPDLSNFPLLADRAQQGMLNFLLLGRLMIHPDGLADDAAFAGVNLDRRALFYDGNSQGGIMGGALTAVAPDFRRAVLGVPGMNYSTLLQRSVDFDQFAAILYPAYPREIERPLIFSLMQQLWDRGEADGYAQHMTYDPLPDTPSHEVLMHPAFGDHQVATVTAEVEARTIGARVRRTPLDPGRSADVTPFYGIGRIWRYPYDGSAIEIWDSGTPTPPTTNTPNRAGADPHSHPRSDVKAREQKSEFLRIGGRVVDVCGGGPCYANGYTGAG